MTCIFFLFFQSKCQNFIQVLGKMDDDKLYVCGTNALKPTCRIYEYKEANLPVSIPYMYQSFLLIRGV